MCGIAGYFSLKKQYDCSTIYRATSLISHRGPDDEGYALFNLFENNHRRFSGPDSPETIKAQSPSITNVSSYEHNLAFGFRRFSIVDLSEKGHQPFWSADGNICLIFNGEIYNYVEIRNELKKLGYSFSTSCDTEVLLTGYQAWGMDILNYCNGPIALALLDRQKNKLFLARDRIGKSPLYYAIHNGMLYWASEIKSILCLAGHTSFSVNDQAVYDYLNFGWRDINNTTFWKEIYTLPSATWTKIDLGSKPDYNTINSHLHQYWTFPEARQTTKDLPFREAVPYFKELFTDAVRIRARADAKVAFSLSGGMDSSSIVATAANILAEPFRTYSIKLPGEKQDEEPLARTVFQRYPDKIDYCTYVPGNDDFWQVANDFIWLQEEPFHFPNTELFQAYFREARKENYKVMLIGAGGDELLAGYRDYFHPLLINMCNTKRYMPLLSNLFATRHLWPKYCVRKRLRILRDLFVGHVDEVYQNSPVSFFNHSGNELALNYLKNINILHPIIDRRKDIPIEFHAKTVGYMSNWLMNYWLRNSNKSHFGVPMETRSPFLDYRLIDYVFSLPPEYLFNYGWTKYLLRQSMKQWLPKKVLWKRGKQGLPFNTLPWFTQAKPIVEKYLKSVYDNPYINTTLLMQNYEMLLQRYPSVLWRAINLCLWWKRVILKESL